MTLLALTQGKILEGFRAPILAGVLATVVSWLLTPWVRSFAISKGAVDDPTIDDRRVHTEPTPRWGGLAIYGGIVAALGAVLPFAYPHGPFPMYLIGMLLIGAVVVVMGALDDLYQYRASIQALFLLAAGVAVQFFFDPERRIQITSVAIPFSAEPRQLIMFGVMAIPLTSIYIFVVTKTMDTIDGIDGLAAGIREALDRRREAQLGPDARGHGCRCRRPAGVGRQSRPVGQRRDGSRWPGSSSATAGPSPRRP